jgi:hypothetical protein
MVAQTTIAQIMIAGETGLAEPLEAARRPA